jgi:hypothetical protein
MQRKKVRAIPKIDTLAALREEAVGLLRARGLDSALGVLQNHRELAIQDGKIHKRISEAELNAWIAEADQVEREVRELAATPISERFAELRRAVPEEELACLPDDLSESLDHYLYGAPKEDGVPGLPASSNRRWAQRQVSVPADGLET